MLQCHDPCEFCATLQFCPNTATFPQIRPIIAVSCEFHQSQQPRRNVTKLTALFLFMEMHEHLTLTNKNGCLRVSKTVP